MPDFDPAGQLALLKRADSSLGLKFFNIAKTLTSSDILSLYANPITLVDAPGLNKMIIPLQATVAFHPGIISYSGAAQSLYINYEASGMEALMSVSGDFSSSSEVIYFFDGGSTFINKVAQPISYFENQSLAILFMDSALTDGDGTMTVNLIYSILNI